MSVRSALVVFVKGERGVIMPPGTVSHLLWTRGAARCLLSRPASSAAWTRPLSSTSKPSTEKRMTMTEELAAKKLHQVITWQKKPKPYRGPETLPKPTRRIGAIGLKVGMIGLYDKWGQRHPCTVIMLDDVQALQVKREETEGYTGVQLGASEKKLKRVNKPQAGHFAKFGVGPKRKLWEFRCTPDALLAPGTQMYAQHFVPGQLVDVCGISKGKGFAGVMKRWNFKGQPASHGVSLAHRSAGSIGQSTTPGKVFKGKKMAGRLGGERVTVQNLWLYKIDTEHNLLYVKGHVPGNKGCHVRITDAIKGAKWPVPPPMPTFYPEEGVTYPREIAAHPPETDPLTPPEGTDDD